MIVEQLVDSRQPEGMLQRIEVVRRHSSTALTNAQEHESLFLMPLWRLLGKTQILVTARNLPKTLLATIALVGLVCVLWFVKYDFTVVADGKLMPELRRDVFAHLDGMVEKVAVRHGDMVEKGQVLAQQRSVDLETQIMQVTGQLAETQQDIQSTERRRQLLDRGQAEEVEIEELTGRMAQLRETVLSLQKQRALLDEKREELKITSPIRGEVVTWKVRELIENRPVRKGQRLMEIADPQSHWELEIYVPEAKMGHIVEYMQKRHAEDPEAKLEVTFILATHSSVRLKGHVEQIDTSAEVHGDSGNTVRMIVSFPQEDLKKLVDNPALELKVGADVKAKVLCGQRSVGFVLFSDLIDFVRAKILFRL